MTEKTVKVAVIGAGYMGMEHVRAFKAMPGVEVAGIFSRTRSRAEALAAEHGIPLVCDSVEELYEKTKADLVVVTVVELSMKEVSKACFKFPWAALLEKPAGMHLPDAEEICAAAKEYGRLAMVAVNRRFYSSTQTVLSAVQEVEGPRYIRVLDQQDQAAALAAGQPAPVVRNWMYANSIHVVDYLRLFGRGKVNKVERIIPFDPENPWMVLAKVEFDSGDVGLYEGVWKGPGPWAVTVCTKQRRWEMRPLEQAVVQNAGERQLKPIDVHPWDSEFKAGLRLQAELALQAVRGGERRVPTLEESLETMRLISDIFAPAYT